MPAYGARHRLMGLPRKSVFAGHDMLVSNARNTSAKFYAATVRNVRQGPEGTRGRNAKRPDFSGKCDCLRRNAIGGMGDEGFEYSRIHR